jgi:hypothetical protein
VLTVLIDDIRWFRDGRDCTIARSSRKAIELLNGLKGRHIDELWLDHDLRGEDTIMPVVDLLCGEKFDVTKVWIHSSNPRGAVVMRQRLSAAGYEVSRSYDLRLWSHSRPKMSDPDVTFGDRKGRE